MKSTFILIVGLVLLASGCQESTKNTGINVVHNNEQPGDYRTIRVYGETPNGYPLPQTGIPITKTSLIVKNETADLKKYPEVYYSGKETLTEDELRITCLGSGNPPVRIAQAAQGWLVELGNGENLIFDCGGGTVQNLWSLGIPMEELDKLFVTHLHLDHVGGILPLFDAMGWGRNRPLHVYGSSGATKELGVSDFCTNIEKAANWHITSKRGIASSSGASIIPHEFNYELFSMESPEQLVYDKDDIKVYAFPVVHLLEGAVGYRLEYKDLSFAFTGDSEPSSFEAERCKGVDVFAHEMFLDAETFAKKNSLPVQVARNIADKAHTSPAYLGKVFSIAQPRLGVATHFFLNDDTVDPAMVDLEKHYSNPVVIAQDLMVINVTQNQILIRTTVSDQLMWAQESDKAEKNPNLEPMVTQGVTPEWLSKTKLNQE